MNNYIRLVLGFLFFLTGAAGLEAGTTINVTFVNRSGYPNDQVYVYVTGDQGSTHGYLDLNNGSYEVPRIADIAGMTATLEEIGGSGDVTIPIPEIGGGRIYFSYGADFNALTFNSVDGQPGYGPNDRLLYDKVEFTTDVPGQLNINSTNVDFFSLPYTFSAVDKNTGKKVTYGFQVSRDVVFTAFSDIPEVPEDQEFGNTAIFRENLVQRDGETVWRVIAPDKVAVPSEGHPDPETGDWQGNFKHFSYFWNSYVKDRCWIPNRTITLDYNGVIYNGTVNTAGDSLSWDNGGGTFSRPAWDTPPDPPPTGSHLEENYGHIIFGGAGEFTSGILAPIVNSAIQRGVMHRPGADWDNPDLFYRGDNTPDSPVNHYGKILHHYAINHNCYALSYDDGFGYNTSIFVNEGDTVTINLLPLSGAGRQPWISDYDGDGTSDIGIFRGGSGLWAIRGITRTYFGREPDRIAPGDYNGDGTTDIAVFRPSSGLWAVKGVTRFYFGRHSDFPFPGDYDGDGTTAAAVFRPSTGLWAVRGLTRAYFGGISDTAVSGWFGGGAVDEIAIFRPSTGLWAVRGLTRAYFGGGDDIPKSGNYNGDGSWNIGIFRPASGLWAIRGLTRVYFGAPSDQAVPADYRGQGRDEVGIFRPSTGLWAVRGVTRMYFGSSGDVPATR